MIRVAKVGKPSGFDTKVSTPGNAWLAAHRGHERPPNRWKLFTGKLAQGYSYLCGYAAMHDPTGGTVDHYLSVHHHRMLAYDWDNYRFACGVLNSSKGNADDKVLDPYEVGDGWFEIILPSLQMRLTDAVPAGMREKAEYTLKRLKLRDGERIIRWRQSWYLEYCQGHLSIDGLRRMAPLIASAVESQVKAGG